VNTSRWFSKAALVLFVLALIPLLGYAQPQDRPGRLERFLDLTPEQQAKLEEFRKAGAEERQAHFEKMRKLREDMREAMKNPEANEAKINGLIDEMSKLRADQMKRGLARKMEMKKIFTPEQQEKLARMRDRMADRRGARFFRGGRGWERPGWQRRPFSDFGRRRPPMDRRFWRW
jgi:Spy/CpxP family protein refolding chaperone